MRRTKIVCTIGPATSSEEQLERLMRAGMNVARLNFSHGTHDEHAVVIERIRAISARLGCSIAILQDLQGPKIRPVRLVDGADVTITTRQVAGDAQTISTTYTPLPEDVKAGDCILLDDGLMELRVLGCGGTDVQCQVVHGGMLKEHKGINLPGVAVSAPALTEKDRADLKFGVTHDVDYVALSFVRKPQDVLEAQRLIAYLQAQQSGRHRHPLVSIPLIAKLEKPEAVAHLDEILEVVDGVMVARGDLGVEMPPEKVPLIQKRIIARCNDLGLPVITATQMLERGYHESQPRKCHPRRHRCHYAQRGDRQRRLSDRSCADDGANCPGDRGRESHGPAAAVQTPDAGSCRQSRGPCAGRRGQCAGYCRPHPLRNIGSSHLEGSPAHAHPGLYAL